MRITPEQQIEALERARMGDSMANYAAIIEGFQLKGIPVEQIEPRENVLTFQAWKALGRHVKKGEHGVKVVTWLVTKKTNEQGIEETRKYPKTTAVFHISQTESKR